MLKYDEIKRVSARELASEFEINRESEDGKSYIGGCIEGYKAGYGIMEWKGEESGKYIGYWKRDKMDGKGLLIDSYGNNYKGYWVNGKKHGEGRMKYVNGDEYIG